MHSDHKILLGAGAILLAMTGGVFAASTFYSATAGSGLNFAAISDASGHLGQQTVVCDAAAMASCQNVVSGSASVSVTNAPAVKLQDAGGNGISSDLRGTERPLSVQILDASGNQITSFGGGAGGTNFGSAFPTAGTAIGMTQGGNMTALTGTAGSLNINCTAGCSGANNSVATPPTLPSGAQQLGVNVSGTFTALTGHGTSMDVNITNLNLNGAAASSGSAPVVGATDQFGTSADAACGTDTGTCTIIALAKRLNTLIDSAIPSGTNVIGYTSADPCSQAAKSGAPINLTASGQVITGTSAKKTYICSLNLISATSQNIALVEGTGTTCATNVYGLAGGTTAATGWNLAANGGLTLGSGAGTAISPSADTNATAANVCLLSSSTGQISGHMTYVQQ